MEKPYAQIDWKPLLAPLDEMEEIITATFIASGYNDFRHTEYPKGLIAKKSDRGVSGARMFNREYLAEIRWKEDQNPPPAFVDIAKENPHINAVLVTIQLKQMKSNDHEEAKACLASIWGELKKRAQEASQAIATRKEPVDHGTAQWATLSELLSEDYIQENTKEDISSRLVLGSLQGQLVTVPKRLTEAHAIIQGPPGSGKSRTIINTQLIERLKTSAIVTEVTAGEDLKPTVYGITAGYRAKNGQRIYYINPSDLDNSTRFNPIDFIEGMDDAIYYADLIITNTTFNNHVGDQIWTQSETHLLTALLLYAWGLGGKKRSVEGGKANLGYVRSLLRLGPTGIDALIQENGIEEARNQFSEFIRNSSPNFRLGVFSGLIQRLNPWLNPRIRKLTEVSDFDPEDLRKNLFTFYLAYPVHRRDYKPIMSLALNFLTKLALRKKFDHPLTYILDEFAAYGRVPGIDDMQATIRNRQIGIILGFQDLQQLAKVYSQQEAEVLFTNSDTKIIFATGSPKSQDQISKMLGQTTKVKKTISSSGHINRQTYGAPLLSPAEIGRIPDQHILVLRNKRSPALLKTCEPGKYEHYAKEHPLSEGPKRQIEPEIYQQCEQDKELKFSQALASKQMAMFEQRHREKIRARMALEKARAQGASSEEVAALNERVTVAQAAYMALFSPSEISLDDTETAEVSRECVQPKRTAQPEPAAPETKSSENGDTCSDCPPREDAYEYAERGDDPYKIFEVNAKDREEPE